MRKVHVDSELAVRARTDKRAMEEVWNHSHRIRELRVRRKPVAFQDDYRQQAYFAQILAVAKYDPTLGSFDDYLGAWISSVFDKYRPFEIIRIPRWCSERMPVTLVNSFERWASMPTHEDYEYYERVHRALSALSGRRERLCVELYFGLNGRPKHTPTEIAALLPKKEKVSRQRVCQILERALHKLEAVVKRERKREETHATYLGLLLSTHSQRSSHALHM
jgi:hypothetical protein